MSVDCAEPVRAAADRDLQLIWLLLCCVVGPEAGDHAGGYEAIEGDVDQTAPAAIALGHSVPPCGIVSDRLSRTEETPRGAEKVTSFIAQCVKFGGPSSELLPIHGLSV